MSNFVSLCIVLCEPSPINGYRVQYRPVGSSGGYRTWPANFFDPSINFEVTADPDGTQYEGFVFGDCGNGTLGVGIPWSTGAEDGSSPAESGSAVLPENCGQYRVTNTNGDNVEFFWTTCDGGTPSAVMAPGQVLTLCILDLSPGVPDATPAPGITIEHLGACPVYLDPSQYSGDGGEITDVCTSHPTFSRDAEATAAATLASVSVRLYYEGVSDALTPCHVFGSVIFGPTDVNVMPAGPVDVSCGGTIGSRGCAFVFYTITDVQIEP